MNIISNAIAFSQTLKAFLIFLQLLGKAIAKPKYALLCLWAFEQLWWVDSRLKEMALKALKVPADLQPASLNSELTREIRQRAIAIAWTAKIHPVRPKCLHRSLVLHQWLQAQGINVQLEIGWGQEIGHAWVTYNGKVLNDRADIANITPRLMQI
ncbi:MAG: hypothetical protein RLZZ535_2335 [Cyanobacteriota bacterium]|jgi:hypothetical protein